mmetsp:Transcript_98453/g.211034  ORF Transcript_98453/g.211034 Transcript_98453/m.211034 type:complete len:213 (+) Transcript_98453:68-706(+)
MTDVFVDGFDFGTPESTIEDHFKSVGHVTGVRLLGKGSAVVTFDQGNDADRAVSELDRSTMEGNQRYIFVKLDGKGKGKGEGKSKGKGKRKGSDSYGDFGGSNSRGYGELQEGTVATFFEDKGFGFITPDDGGDDVFIHVKELVNCEALSQGEVVTFDVKWDDRKGKNQGSNCSSKSGGGGGGGGYGGGKGGGKDKGGKGYSPYDSGKGGKW